MDDSKYKTKVYVLLHSDSGIVLYSTESPEKVKEQLGGTCLWLRDADGMAVQMNLREIPLIGVEPYAE